MPLQSLALAYCPIIWYTIHIASVRPSLRQSVLYGLFICGAIIPEDGIIAPYHRNHPRQNRYRAPVLLYPTGLARAHDAHKGAQRHTHPFPLTIYTHIQHIT